MRRRYKWLIGLIAAIGVPYYWLLIDNRPGGDPGPRVRIAELRRLAAEVRGAKPESVRMHTVAWRRVPGVLFVAGGGLKRNLLGIESYTLGGPWGRIVIDSGLRRADAEAMGLERFFPAEQAQVDADLRAARRIVFTHEHLDHINGFLRLPDFARVAGQALVTPEQAPGGAFTYDLPWPAASRTALHPFRYRGLAPVAPGVVLIRTPGHTPGSQMIFVTMADGREILFAGDTATMARSWQQLRARSRLVGDFLVGEDRAAVFGWLKTIRALKRDAPGLIIVAGHDPDQIIATHRKNRFVLDDAAPPAAAPAR
ncbi:MAG TPA: MBL fold metallo-hydrolase [Novosphingobium sp.]|nr:MBL fold metallo-hydrolase [Novosphingobium sp.]